MYSTKSKNVILAGSILLLLDYLLGMHGIGFFADNRYADILQLIWPISDRDDDIHMDFFFTTPNCRGGRVSSAVEFTYGIIMHTLTVLARWQMQA